MPPIKANRKFISVGQHDKELVNVKKGKFHPRTSHEGPEGE